MKLISFYMYGVIVWFGTVLIAPRADQPPRQPLECSPPFLWVYQWCMEWIYLFNIFHFCSLMFQPSSQPLLKLHFSLWACSLSSFQMSSSTPALVKMTPEPPVPVILMSVLLACVNSDDNQHMASLSVKHASLRRSSLFSPHQHSHIICHVHI